MTLTAQEAAVFDAAQAGGGEIGEKNPAPAGWEGVITIASAKLAARKSDGEKFVALDVTTPDGYSWSEFKWFTKGGQPDAGRATSVKILLESFGLFNLTSANLDSSLASLNGKQFKIQRIQDGQWVNTVVQHPVQSAPAPAPTPIGGAQFGDDVPWDQPAAPAPPQSAITGG